MVMAQWFYVVGQELALGCPELEGRLVFEGCLMCLYPQITHVLVVCFGERPKVWGADVVSVFLSLRTVYPEELQFLNLTYFWIRLIFIGCAMMSFYFDFIQDIVFVLESAVYMSSWLFYLDFLFEFLCGLLFDTSEDIHVSIVSLWFCFILVVLFTWF